MSTQDEFAGQGGSYTLDPETGKRTLRERTQDPAFEPEANEPPDAAEPAAEA